jgi:hypothetical protein
LQREPELRVEAATFNKAGRSGDLKGSAHAELLVRPRRPRRVIVEPVGRGRMLTHLAKFALFAGVILFVAWLAGTGRVAYMMVMLWIAAALGYAVVDLVDYEIVKRSRRG